MTVASARAAIASALQTLPGLAVAAYPVPAPGESPSVRILLERVNYTEQTYTFRLALTMASLDEAAAFAEVDAYLEPSGPKSINAVLLADPGCVTIEASAAARDRTGRGPAAADIIVTYADLP